MNVIVTGASKGLGKAIAARFASENNHLFLCARGEQALMETAAEIRGMHPAARVSARCFDLSVGQQAKDFGLWVLDTGGPVDILINNAGSFLPGNIRDEPEGLLEKMIDANVMSAYHLTRALLPSMMERGCGHIFNMCSIASLQAYPNGGAYSISKFALAGFSRNLREELKPLGIKVTTIYPGAVYTDSWAGSGVDPKRIMESGDVADMVFAAAGLSLQANVEEIILRPLLGDL
jgi:short-subunit dehydrogenase